MSYRIVDDDVGRISEWVARRNGGNGGNAVAAIGLERRVELIAGVTYENYLGRSICIHTAIERMNAGFLWYSFYYPFIELGVVKVIGLVDSFNSRAVRLDLHLGFVLEHAIKDAAPKGDLLVFSMTREKCRWLSIAHRRGPHGQQGQRSA